MRVLPLLALTTVLCLGSSAAFAADLAMGKQLFTTNCVKCHGAQAQGGIGKKLTGDADDWDPATFKRAVREGIDDEGHKLKTIMPHFGKVGLSGGTPPTDEQLDDIQAYVLSLDPKHK